MNISHEYFKYFYWTSIKSNSVEHIDTIMKGSPNSVPTVISFEFILLIYYVPPLSSNDINYLIM